MLLKQVLKLPKMKNTMILKQITALTAYGALYWLVGRLL